MAIATELSSHTPSSNLPSHVTPFIGREHEFRELKARLAASRWVTLVGPGGSGKTRLAVETASALAGGYADGMRFVDLAAVAEPALVRQAVASALGVRELPGASLADVIVDYLRDRRLLLVLDHCEQVLGASAQLLANIVAGCSGVSLLATSREPLGAPQEHVYQLPPLSFPTNGEAAWNPTDLIHFDAVRLLVDRAAAVSPGFALTTTNAPAVVAICRQLDGLPLAIELAAARVNILPIERIAQLLQTRFRLLDAETSSTAPPPETLRAAVEWSYTLMNLQERTLLSRLSVFAGSCTVEAVRAVCVSDGIADSVVPGLLGRLVDKSVVVSERRDGELRYRLLDTLRLYASGRLVSDGNADRVRARHALHYLALAEELETQLWGPDVVAYMDRIEAEHDNIRAALRWSAGRGEAEIALRLCAALWRFWQVRGHLTEGLRWLDGALRWREGASPQARAQALDAAGNLARSLELFDRAAEYFQLSLDLQTELADTRGMALALNQLSIAAQLRGDVEAAMGYQERSLDHFRELDDKPGLAIAVITLGTMAEMRGEHGRARELYEESLGRFRDLEDARGMAAALNNLGNVATDSGDMEAGQGFYAEALVLFRDLGDTAEEAACLKNLALVKCDCGDYDEASASCRESLALFYQLLDMRGITACLDLLMRLASAERDYERAARLLGAAQGLREAGGSSLAPVRPGRHERAERLARLALGQQAFDDAVADGRRQPLHDAIAYALSWDHEEALTASDAVLEAQAHHQIA